MAELQWSNWPVDEFHIINNITGEFAATAPFPPWKPEHPHMGIDIGVFTGTRVLAPAAGREVTSGPLFVKPWAFLHFGGPCQGLGNSHPGQEALRASQSGPLDGPCLLLTGGGDVLA